MIVSISTPQSCTTQCDLLQLCEVALRKQEQQQGESFMLLFFVVIKSSLAFAATLLRYDTRCYINVRSKANMGRLNLPHGADNEKV